MSARPRRARVSALVIACLLTLAACSNGHGGGTPTWVPQPDLQHPVEPQPELPQGQSLVPEPQPSLPGPSLPGPSSPGPSGPSGAPGPSGSPSTTTQPDPNVVATKLNQPTGLIVMPDGTALVGERTTGRILRVQPTPGSPARLVQTLSGLDASGDGGLLDLALSPTFSQDGLIFAYITTPTDNRVIHFALGTTPTPVITGIPKGATGNVGRIMFDAAGALITGTGDAGQPALAANPDSLAGKILRTDDLGHPESGNPNPASIVFARGFRSVDGLCVNPQTGTRFAISTSPQDEVNRLKPGADYGWPATGAGATPAAGTLPTNSGGGGCTVSQGRLVVAASTGTCLEVAPLGAGDSFKSFTKTIQKIYGRLRTVVSAPDGAVWVTTVNRDGRGKPTADDDRVLRIRNLDGGAGSVV